MAQFGNWVVTLEGIEWAGPQNDSDPDSKRIIPTDALLSTRNGDLYEWPLHIVKASSKKEDIYAFNTAFVFALEFHRLGFSANISLMKTFLEQARQINENEEDQPDESTIGNGNSFEL